MLKPHWRNQAIERIYRRIGVLLPDESLVLRHHLVTEWVVQYDGFRSAGSIDAEYRKDETPWCHALNYAVDRQGRLEVRAVKMNLGNCSTCNQLNFNWLKARGV